MASQELAFSLSTNDYSGLCRICERKSENLRILSCLHVFCEGCLKKMQENETFNNVIRCQVCGQETELNSKDVSRLPLDSLSCNRIYLKAIDIAKTICGSCKTGEVAVGHCTDCASFLCQNCYTAHQIMCYFQNHQVCSFEDMKENEECFTVTQKHITCKCHPDEILKYYCHTCHIPICCECIVLDHKQPKHCYAKTFDAEREERHKLKELIEECKSKVSFCEEAKTVLQSHLHELQEQHDCIKPHIESTCLSLKTILENQLQQSLREVEEIHSFQKTQLTETFNNAKKTIKKIEHACRFAEKVLNYGNNIEFLSLIHVVRKQLTYLIHNSSKPDISVGMIFETDKYKFETTIKEIFGHIKNAESPAKKKESPYSWEASSVNFSSSLDSDNSNFSTGNSSSNSLPQTDFDFKNNMVAQLNLIHLANLENRRTEENLSSFSSGTLPIPVSQNKLLINYIQPDVTPPQFDEINYSTALFNREPISLSNSLPAKENHSYRPKQRSSGIKPKTMHSRYKFGRKGSGKLEFNLPHGFCLGLKEEIIVADTNNHRIQVFGKHGNITYQFGIPGKKKGELWFPRKVVRKQLTYLIHNSSKPDISVGMIFETDKYKFETTIKEIFGHIKNAESPAKKKESPYSWEASSVNFSSSLDSDNSNFSTGNSSSNSLPQTDFDFKNNMVAQLNLIHLANLENRRTEENLSSFSSGTLPIPVSQNKLLINYIQPDVTPPQFDEINYSTALFNREPISLSNSLPAKENHSYRPKQRSSGIKPKTMHSRYKFGRKGSGKLEFNLPHGFCLGLKEEIIVADTNNHRIQVFGKHGNITYQFGIPGKKKGELWFPRKVAVIQSSESFVVCDRGSLGSRMQVFSKAGHFLKEINIRYIFIISGLVTTKEDTIIIVDSIKLRVFIISYYGDLLYSFDCSGYTKEPSDIAVYQNEFYICDFKGHCVAVFSDKGNFLRNFGSKSLTKYPTGIHITGEGKVLVADSHRNSYHIAIFSQQGVLLDEFECPYIKVNLCCGLKVTSEGFVITVAKHNHQVLVFDPLYILPNTTIKPSSVDVI